METVIILLSTYNGEKYLKEQLDSLFSQENVHVNLLIRDDGSMDQTLSILHHYQNIYPDQIEIIEGVNVGWMKSYLILADYALTHYSENKYFAFSDQDDIWLPAKMGSAINALNNMGAGCNLYCCNLFYYKDGKNSGKIRSANIISTYKSCLVKNHATGCTIVFNRELLELIVSSLPKISIAHDHWFYMVAMLCGKVLIDNEAYILYRQHENNQIGIRGSFRDVWKRRIKNLLNSKENNLREITAKELMRCVGTNMNPEAKKAVMKIANYRISIVNRTKLLLDSGYTIGKRSNDFWLKMRIIFGSL